MPCPNLNPLAASLILAFVTGAFASTVHAQQTATVPPAVTLSPVVVTATKQERSLFETPASAGLIDGDALERQGLQSLADVAQQLGNVYFTDFTGSTPTLTVRGLGFSDDESDSLSTSVLIDGMAVVGSALGTLFDLERIELLRGPQSTLYGQNSMGGLVAIRTRDPGFVFGGGAQVEYSSGKRWRTSAALDLPLAERTAVRLAVGTEDADGYVHNKALGRDDTAGWRSRFARLKLLHVDDAGGEWRFGLHRATRDGGNDFFVTPALARAHASVSSDAGRNDVAYTLLTGEYTRRLDDGRRLAVTLGGTEAQWNFWMPQSLFGGPSGFDNRTRQFSAEARLNSAPADTGGIDWLTGAYASRVRKSSPYLFEIPGYMRSATTADVEGGTAAVFGELGWRFAPQWRLAGALRLEHDRRRMDWTSAQSGYYDSDGDGVPDTPYASTDRVDAVKTRDTVLLPRLTLEWQPAEQQFAWATLARGYKASGFNLYAYDPASAATPYAPEYGNHLELGWRMRGAGNRWDMGATVFRTQLRDQQVVVIGAGGASLVGNAGRSHSQGVELNAALRPARGLEFSAFAGWVEAQYDSYAKGGVDYAGQQFPNTPRSSYGVAVQWKPVAGWETGLSLKRIGRSALYPDSSVANPAYTLVDAHLSYRTGRWTLGLYGKNLGDARYLVRALNAGSVVAGAPRTVGVRVAADF
ncbi:TonB-dependent receptor [Paracidovorax avenae]